MIKPSRIYNNRFSKKELSKKSTVWKTLCEAFFSKYIKQTDTVLDVGAGFCEFINNISCKRRIANDVNEEFIEHANDGVETIIGDIGRVKNLEVDKVMLSNILEHLNTKDEVIEMLLKVHSILKPNGQVLIVQPNINLVKEEYWSFIDHKVALNEKSVTEALETTGFKVEKVIKRFLPYTIKSSLPTKRLYILFYLLVPQFFRVNAGQSFFLASKV